MGTLTEEMTHLYDDIRKLRDNRREFLVQTQESVGELRQQAKSAIKSTRAARAEKARESGSVAEQFLKDLRADVQRIKREATDLRDRFGRDFAEIAESSRSEREASVEDLKDRAEALRNEVQQLQARLRHDRSAAAEQSRRELAEFLSELQSYVRELCDGFREAREEKAKTSSSERAAFVSGIAGNIAGLRAEVASELKAARTAFFGPTSAELKTEEERRRAEREDRERERGERAEADKARQHPDDLTAIAGIGPKMQERLNEKAGIYAYAQLAVAEPESLCETFEDLPGSTIENVKQWVAEASELARQ